MPSERQPDHPVLPRPHVLRQVTGTWRAPLSKISPADLGDPAKAELLAVIANAYPEYRIWQAVTSDRIQFVAQAIDLITSPHTLVTTSLVELAGELNSARPTCLPVLPTA